MTATIEIYSFPKVVTLTLGGNTGGSQMNYPINNTDFSLVKGVTNEILFFVKNVDRQPITANALANAGIIDLRIAITDMENNQFFFGDQTAPIANAVDHSVLTPYTLTDPSKGVWMLSVTASDINDWPLGYLKYSIVGDRTSGDQVMLYTDRQYGPYSNLKVLEGPYPMPPEAIIIEQSDMINSAVFQSNATSIVSSAYPGSAAVGNISGYQSAVANISAFSGTILVEASLENQPSQNSSDWFMANVASVNNGVVDGGLISFTQPTDGPIYFDFIGNYMSVRFTVTIPYLNGGTFYSLAYRNN